MSDILKDSWVFDCTPRLNQVKALKWLDKQTAKYLIMEAPVGSGKSFSGITFSKHIAERTPDGDAFVLTPQKILQEQYEKTVDRKYLSSFYGRSNYSCHAGSGIDCEIGKIFGSNCGGCPYKEARHNAMMSPNAVMNYTLALSLFAYTDILPNRKLMILDECHVLESNLVEFDTVKITKKMVVENLKLTWKQIKEFPEALVWLNSVYHPELKTYFMAREDAIQHLIDMPPHDLTKTDLRALRAFEKIKIHVNSVEAFLTQAEELGNTIQQHFVYTFEYELRSFKRLTGKHAFRRLLEPKADKFLFMSSTVLNKEGFCRDLGLDIKDTAFISLPSEFPPSNRPIFYIPTMRMNYEWDQPKNKQFRKDLLNTFISVCEFHPKESGIVHTGNFKIAKWLVEEINGEVPHKILHHNPSEGERVNRMTVINQFMSGSHSPCILISPSITEGLDLKDEMARFAIFLKVPFGNLMDQWIKRRMELSNEWYQRMAIIDVIQGGGRVVRSAEDWGSVYILDGSFGRLYNSMRTSIPQWWKDAYTKLDI